MNLPYVYRNIPWMENASKIFRTGRVLVRMDTAAKPRLELYNCEGSKLPAYLIFVVMKIALGDGWLEKIETLHQNRKGVWKVDVEVDPTAAKVYRLFSKENDEPFCSSAITVSKNQVHTFSIFGEDAAPLLKEIIKDYPPIFLPRYRNYRYTYCFPTHYAQTIQFKELPEVIKLQDSETQRIKVDKETFRNGTLQAGNTSGIIETIEAMKCLEVLLA